MASNKASSTAKAKANPNAAFNRGMPPKAMPKGVPPKGMPKGMPMKKGKK